MEAVQSLVRWKAHHCRYTPVTDLHPQHGYRRHTFVHEFITTVTDFWLHIYSFAKVKRIRLVILTIHKQGLTNYESNSNNNQFVVAWAATQNSCGSQAGYGPISSILPGEVHVTSQLKHTLRIIGTKWQSNKYTGKSKADKLWTSNKEASKEQLKAMSKQLVMKSMWHLHKLPKCPERKCK